MLLLYGQSLINYFLGRKLTILTATLAASVDRASSFGSESTFRLGLGAFKEKTN
jgi:hypothetical protein